MSNVNDLHRTSPEEITNAPRTQQTISLSALNNNNNKTTNVNINATNGLSGVSEEVESRPVVRINPANKKIDPARRQVVDVSELNAISGPKKEAVVETPQDKAMNALDRAVKRKRDEFREFVKSATQDDEMNRSAVEDGLATVNDEEVQYMPVDLQTRMDDSQRIKSNNDFDDSYDFDDPAYRAAPSPHIDNMNPDMDIEVDYDGDDMVAPSIDDCNQFISSPFDDEIEEDVEPDMNNEPIDLEALDRELTEKHNSNNIDTDEDYSLIQENMEPEEDIDNPNRVVVEETEEFEDEEVNEVEENTEETPTAAVIDQEEFDISNGAIMHTESALEPISASSSDFDIDDVDFEDVTTDTEENLTDDQIMEISEASEKNFRSEILQKIVNTGKKINTAQFSVSNKVVSIKEALKHTDTVARTATWPLTFAGRPYKASALKGPEIALMADADASNENGIGLTMSQARIMFEHDANPYRPSTLEAWAKTIPFADVENIFAALYLASIQGANYIPMACPKKSCQNAFLMDDVDINKMVKFDSDASRKNFEKIKNIELTKENTSSYESVINVINDKFAVGLKIPSIYTILYEYNSLNNEFVSKYTAMVSIVQYIDYMYVIDSDTNQLVPIGWRNYHGDHTKTFKSKIATYAKILKEFDDTDFSILMALINSMISKMTDLRNITFEIAASTCPKCGAEIAAREINARGMLFMRQRLVELATTPIEK